MSQMVGCNCLFYVIYLHVIYIYHTTCSTSLLIFYLNHFRAWILQHLPSIAGWKYVSNNIEKFPHVCSINPLMRNSITELYKLALYRIIVDGIFSHRTICTTYEGDIQVLGMAGLWVSTYVPTSTWASTVTVRISIWYIYQPRDCCSYHCPQQGCCWCDIFRLPKAFDAREFTLCVISSCMEYDIQIHPIIL